MLLRQTSIIHANAEYSLINNDFKDEDESLLSSKNKSVNNLNSLKSNINAINKIQTNIFLLVPLIFFVSLLLGTIFYKVHHKWELSTSFYYSAQVLAGCMYDMPTELDPVSNYFSLLFFLFGTTVMAFLFGIFVSNLVRKKRNLLNKKEEDSIEHKHNISNKGYLSKILASPLLVNLKVWTMWSVHKDKYITVFLAFMWLCIGVAYGLYYEEWSFSESFRFALGAMAASGVPPPICDPKEGYDDCQLGDFRGVFVGTYVIIGVPLFAFTLGQFAGMIVEQAIIEREMQIMARPLGQSEFTFALNLNTKCHGKKNNSKRTGENREDYRSGNYGACSSTGTSNHNDRNDNSDSRFQRKFFMPSVAEGIREDQSECSSREGREQRSASGDDLHSISQKAFNDNSYGAKESMSSKGRRRANSESCITMDKGRIKKFTSDSGKSTDSKPDFSAFCIDFGDFVVLEMLRLARVDEQELGRIRSLFDEIDFDHTGTIDQVKLQRLNDSYANPASDDTNNSRNSSTISSRNSSTISSPYPSSPSVSTNGRGGVVGARGIFGSIDDTWRNKEHEVLINNGDNDKRDYDNTTNSNDGNSDPLSFSLLAPSSLHTYNDAIGIEIIPISSPSAQSPSHTLSRSNPSHVSSPTYHPFNSSLTPHNSTESLDDLDQNDSNNRNSDYNSRELGSINGDYDDDRNVVKTKVRRDSGSDDMNTDSINQIHMEYNRLLMPILQMRSRAYSVSETEPSSGSRIRSWSTAARPSSFDKLPTRVHTPDSHRKSNSHAHAPQLHMHQTTPEHGSRKPHSHVHYRRNSHTDHPHNSNPPDSPHSQSNLDRCSGILEDRGLEHDEVYTSSSSIDDAVSPSIPPSTETRGHSPHSPLMSIQEET